VSSFKILTELEVLLWCDITLMQVDPAFAIGAVVDTLHDFIASSVLFSLSLKERVILTDHKQVLRDLQTSSPVFPELRVWLAYGGEQLTLRP